MNIYYRTLIKVEKKNFFFFNNRKIISLIIRNGIFIKLFYRMYFLFLLYCDSHYIYMQVFKKVSNSKLNFFFIILIGIQLKIKVFFKKKKMQYLDKSYKIILLRLLLINL